ncbi:MAG: Hpt domain-containing protein [Lachnospiraceae bacterium]|nr:Hpt domain-containing protein [Lachnospiraceae bacterium]
MANYITEDILRQTGFIDIDYGLECCAGMLDLYMHAAEDYVGCDNKLEKLTESFEKEDWANYIVDIHAVKSSSMLLGMTALGEEAKQLELAIKEENYNYVKDNHLKVLKEYERIIGVMEKLLNDYDIPE